MTWRNPFLAAALAAAEQGWCVFPVIPAGKTPAIKTWQELATNDIRQIFRWWPSGTARNVGIATGRSGLVVVDLDQGRGGSPPERFRGARDGRDALAVLAAEAGAEPPTDTYTVSTPGGGAHLYFQAPSGLELRCTSGTVGWRIDTRARGGYVVGAGSRRGDGSYGVIQDRPVAELPGWLLRALTPAPPPEPGPPIQLPGDRASAYVHAIVTGEVNDVASAQTGTRHHTLLKAARTLGRLVAGGELAEDDAWQALLSASAGHVGIDGCTAAEVHRTIGDGLAYGKRLPRRIARDRTLRAPVELPTRDVESSTRSLPGTVNVGRDHVSGTSRPRYDHGLQR